MIRWGIGLTYFLTVSALRLWQNTVKKTVIPAGLGHTKVDKAEQQKNERP